MIASSELSRSLRGRIHRIILASIPQWRVEHSVKHGGVLEEMSLNVKVSLEVARLNMAAYVLE